MKEGLKLSQKAVKGDVASGLLLLATLGLATVAIFIVLAALQHRYSVLQGELGGVALLGALAGGFLTRNWTDSLRAVLNGIVIASGYMSVYFIDALIEDRKLRHLTTIAWTLGSIAVLVVALKVLERLPAPAADAEDMI
jgi:hypothetical protein